MGSATGTWERLGRPAARAAGALLPALLAQSCLVAAASAQVAPLPQPVIQPVQPVAPSGSTSTTPGGPVAPVDLQAPVAAQIGAGDAVDAVPPVVAQSRAFDRDGDDITADTGFNLFIPFVRGLDYGVGLVSEYGDNLLRLPDGVQPSGGRVSRADFRFRPSAFVRGSQPFGRQTLFVNATYGRDFYARNTRLNRQRLSIDGGVDWRLGARCGGQVAASYAARQSELELFDAVISNEQRRTGVLLSAGCPSRVGLSPNLSVALNRIDNELPERKRADARSSSFSGGLSYALGARGTATLSGSYTDARFPNSVITVPALVPVLGPGGAPLLDRDGRPVFAATLVPVGGFASRFYGVNGGVSYRFGPSITVNLGLGYSRSKSRVRPIAGREELAKQAALPGFSGLVYSAGVDYRGPRIGGGVAVARSVTPSPGGSAAFFVTTRYELNLGYDLGPNGRAYAGVARLQRDFRGQLLQETVNVRNAEKADRAFIGYDRDLGRLLSAGVRYTYQRRLANPSVFNYDNNLFTLRLSANF